MWAVTSISKGFCVGNIYFFCNFYIIISPIKCDLSFCDLRQQNKSLAGGTVANPVEVISKLQV